MPYSLPQQKRLPPPPHAPGYSDFSVAAQSHPLGGQPPHTRPRGGGGGSVPFSPGFSVPKQPQLPYVGGNNGGNNNAGAGGATPNFMTGGSSSNGGGGGGSGNGSGNSSSISPVTTAENDPLLMLFDDI